MATGAGGPQGGRAGAGRVPTPDPVIGLSINSTRGGVATVYVIFLNTFSLSNSYK